MTVKQLIEQLKTLPQNKIVWASPDYSKIEREYSKAVTKAIEHTIPPRAEDKDEKPIEAVMILTTM